MYNKPVPQVCLDPVLVTWQSWVMAGNTVHLRAEGRESAEGEDILALRPATQTLTGLSDPKVPLSAYHLQTRQRPVTFPPP